ncbi:MAG: hypothetical protein LC725_05200, partial [Lentisphaerae bacterium]|nr:hypothetical protein [Lentisphaerota bacterium]
MSRGRRAVGWLCLALLAGGGLASASPTKAISDLISLIKDHGAAFERPEFDRDLPQAVARIFDPAAELMTAAAAELRWEADRGVYYDAGLRLEPQGDGPPLAQTLPEGPATAAGIPEDAAVTAIDGRQTAGVPVTELRAWLRGQYRQPLQLEFQAPEESESRTITVERTMRQSPVTGWVEEWPMQIAFMRIYGVFEDSGGYISRQVAEWADSGFSGVIMDLRGGAGADYAAVAEAAGLFMDQDNTIFLLRNGHGEASDSFQPGPERRVSLPIMALIDGNTRGAAEVFAALLRQSRAAMLLGAPSCGDMTLRQAIPLDKDQVFYMAVSRAEITSDPALYRLTPDVLIAPQAAAWFPPEAQ